MFVTCIPYVTLDPKTVARILLWLAQNLKVYFKKVLFHQYLSIK